MMLSLPDVPRMPDPGLYELLQAMRRQVIENTRRITDAGAGGASGGDAGTGERDPPSFVIDYESSLDAYYADAAAADMYVRAGKYPTTRVREDFTKHMAGRGQFTMSDRVVPANFGYLGVKPTTAPVQGYLGWFDGDQTFADAEWKIVGPLVRTYDLAARYFESNTIPHHAWFEVESGNSGIAAYCLNGVNPGNTVTLAQNTSFEWTGKPVQIRNGFGGPLMATLTVASVAGQVVTFTTSHGLTMAWNPPSSAPCLSFAPRTWAGHTYVFVRARGGGDIYGHMSRVSMEYQPKVSELVHTYNAMTGAQYGGSIDFLTTRVTLSSPASTGSTTVNVTPALTAQQITYVTGKRASIRAQLEFPPWDFRTVASATANTITFTSAPSLNHPTGSVITIGPDGTYATGWESQFNDMGADVAAIAFVNSFARLNDRADGGGRVWLGSLMKSDTRPSDAGHVVAGIWRRGLDTTQAALVDGSYLTVASNNGDTTLRVKWPSGARIGHLVNVNKGTFQAVITAVGGDLLSIDRPVTGGPYPLSTLVDFPDGGAAVAMAFGQWINWDATAVTTGRSADPLGVWGPLYGNQSGYIWSGTGEDVNGRYWQIQNHEARLRVRDWVVSTNMPIQTADQIQAGKDLITNASVVSGAFQGALIFGSGAGEYLAFNTATGKYEFYINGALVFSIP